MTTIGYKWCILLPRIFQIATLWYWFKLSQPNYTVNTLVHLEEISDHEFSLIMGEDNLKILV
jgi:nicotinic acid mononucleotide adenylyltransferase